MGIPSSFRDKDFRKFVESPTRPDQTAVEVVGSFSISDQDGDYLQINPDGSLNFNLSQPTTKILFDEVTGVANGVTTTVITFTPSTDIKLVGIDVSGNNIAQYEILHGASLINKKLTYFGSSLNAEFNLSGITIPSGDTISVDVTHSRMSNGDFNASIKYQEI